MSRFSASVTNTRTKALSCQPPKPQSHRQWIWLAWEGSTQHMMHSTNARCLWRIPAKMRFIIQALERNMYLGSYTKRTTMLCTTASSEIRSRVLCFSASASFRRVMVRETEIESKSTRERDCRRFGGGFARDAATLCSTGHRLYSTRSTGVQNICTHRSSTTGECWQQKRRLDQQAKMYNISLLSDVNGNGTSNCHISRLAE